MSTIQASDVTVVIPVFNGARYLEQAVDSIRSQTLSTPQIIVVDDGSTDETPQVCQKLEPEVLSLRQENKGAAAARNRGIETSNSRFISFLDADDLWPVERLSVLCKHLEKAPELDFVLGQTQVFCGAEYRQPHHHWLLGSGLYRKRVFEKIGILEPELRAGEDLDWFLRARRQKAKFSLLTETTLFLRREKQNMTHNKTLKELNFLKVIKRHMDGRRS